MTTENAVGAALIALLGMRDEAPIVYSRQEFDLSAVRATCAPFFRRLDIAVDAGDSRSAKRERRALLAHARSGLAGATAEAGGVYLFYRPTSSIGINDLVYVGIAESASRPLRTRILDRLRNDSCFDVGLDDLPRAEAARIVRRRLEVAMPKSAKDYVEDHLRTSALVSGSLKILLNATRVDPLDIRAAERVLIASARALGAPLMNKRDLTTSRQISANAERLARSVIEGLVSYRWSSADVSTWSAKLDETFGAGFQSHRTTRT